MENKIYNKHSVLYSQKKMGIKKLFIFPITIIVVMKPKNQY